MNTPTSEHEHLVRQLRAVNEQLVLSAIRSDELADAARASRDEAANNAERFRCLVKSAAAVVWSADATGRIAFDRESWDSFVGLELDDSDEDGWLAAVHPADHAQIRIAWAHARATTTPYSCQHRLLRLDRTYGWVASRAAPVGVADEVREWIGMMTDISERVRIEEAREQFIAILGHDLRNPLAAISLGAALLGNLPPPHGRLGVQIARSAHRMEVLIRDVMDFTRGRLGGGIPVLPKLCDLAGICSEVIAEMRTAHPERDIRFSPGKQLRAMCDTDRLEQVISNLVGNAVVHGHDPIVVTATDDGDWVELTVESSGEPLSQTSMNRMFEPYTRRLLQPSGENSTPGLGLGLYIVSEIVRAHAGTIAVSSGERTRFTVRIPRTPS